LKIAHICPLNQSFSGAIVNLTSQVSDILLDALKTAISKSGSLKKYKVEQCVTREFWFSHYVKF